MRRSVSSAVCVAFWSSIVGRQMCKMCAASLRIVSVDAVSFVFLFMFIGENAVCQFNCLWCELVIPDGVYLYLAVWLDLSVRVCVCCSGASAVSFDGGPCYTRNFLPRRRFTVHFEC